jgi:hypothetical protein
MNAIEFKLNFIKSEIKNIDLDKKEQKFFVSLEILDQKLSEMKNLTDDLSQLNDDNNTK